MSGVKTEELLQGLVVQEARLIDDGAYEQWLELFSDDGGYWIPLRYGDTDPNLQPALLYEDRLLLQVRVERLLMGQAHSLQPVVRCLHVLQQPEVEWLDAQAGEARVQARYVYIETQAANQVVLGCVATYHWVQQGEAWKIRLKKVQLLNPEAPLPMIQLMP